MDIGLHGVILAIVTTDANKICGGTCPIFAAHGDEEKEELGFKLARVLGGTVHDLGNGVYIICRHH